MAYFNSPIRNGDRVSGDAKPGEVVSYQLTPEEIAARYGPPAAPTGKKPFALDPRLWAPKKGGDKDMAVKMTQQEALRMQDTADRLAPVTQPAKRQAATINPEFEAAVQAAEAEMSGRSVPTKRCSKCGETKPLGEFPARGAWCKECRRAYDAERMRKARAAKAAVDIAPAIAPAIAAPAATPEPDQINHPAHYTAGKVECIDALEAATEGLQGIEAVCTANVIKYLWRWRHKGGLEDLRKAQWYLQRLIDKKEAEQ